MRSSKVARVLPVVASERLRWWAGAGGLLLLLLSMLYLRYFLSDPQHLPVRHVEMIGTLDYADRDALQAIVTRHVDDGFARLDLGALQADIQEEPWIASAIISRRSPDQIVVQVHEHRPVARWNQHALISSKLFVFEPPQLRAADERFLQWQAHFASLPALEGAMGREVPMLQAWRDYGKRLGRLDLQVSRLVEDERYSRTLVLANGITVRLGTRVLEERLSRFIDVYAQLEPHKAQGPATFDMRYLNGFAYLGPGNPDSLLSQARDS